MLAVVISGMDIYRPSFVSSSLRWNQLQCNDFDHRKNYVVLCIMIQSFSLMTKLENVGFSPGSIFCLNNSLFYFYPLSYQLILYLEIRSRIIGPVFFYTGPITSNANPVTVHTYPVPTVLVSTG